MGITANRINVVGNMIVGAPAAGSTPWTESDVLTNLGSGLSVWLKQTNQVSGGGITYWGTNATQSNFYMLDSGGHLTAGFASIPGQFGGVSALQLNNSGWMERSWSAPPFFADIFQRTSYHIFAVVRVASVDTNSGDNWKNDAVLGDSNNAGAGFFCFKGASAPYTMYSYHQSDSGIANVYGGYALAANGTVALNTDYLMETWYDGSSLNVRLGNNPTATVSGINSLTAGFNSYDVRLGANTSGGTLDGAVASVMFCTSALDPTSQAKVREYFGTTYGVAY